MEVAWLVVVSLDKTVPAVVQQALAMDRALFLGYDDGYSCGATDYGTQPVMVRLDATI